MSEHLALENITILDLTRVIAGPYCGAMLADLGANVIKIELPGRGDDARAYGPYVNGESLYYGNLNRNKRGITLNLKSEEGKEVFRKLAAKADEIVQLVPGRGAAPGRRPGASFMCLSGNQMSP